MFFLDLPYVSKFLQRTLYEKQIPIVKTESLCKLDLIEGLNIISEEESIEMIKNNKDMPLYCTSENSIGWIYKNLNFLRLSSKINLFKDKLIFREMIKSIYPEFYFKELRYDELGGARYEDFPQNFVLKPSVGFMSAGVHIISDKDEFKDAKESIKREFSEISDLYPEEVLSAKKFIIEELIYGDEYAVDVYFDLLGEPVILNIFKHIFFDNSDVGDRVYSTSKEIVKSNIEEFKKFLKSVGDLAKIRNFPLHVELRKDKFGNILPIEINPMRFGGWCTTADITYLAFGFNPYLYYYEQNKPNWSEIFDGVGDELYSIVVLDNSTGISTKKIDYFDYEKLLSKFKQPLELRKIDFHTYPVFGFLFVKTKKENIEELEYILGSDLREFTS